MENKKISRKAYIFHIDVNSAFLSWSAVKRLQENPEALDLRTVPSAVGGDVESRHGIITAKSIPEKKYHVETGEPVVKALQKCPNLILIPSDFQTYRKYSKAFMRILRSYTPLVEQASIDEAYLDMTGTEALFREQAGEERPFPLCAADEIRRRIREELGFTVNVGISENKLLAKTASDFAKPDRTHTLWPEEIPEKYWTLPIGKLFGCGAATAARLRNIGVKTIGDAAHTEQAVLQSILGEKGGRYIWRSANGRGSAAVHPDESEAKGYSNERTTAMDITPDNYDAEMPPLLSFLAESVAARLRRDSVYASTIGVMVKTDSFQRHSRQRTLGASTNSTEEIFRVASVLMEELLAGPDGLFGKGDRIRLAGVSAVKLDRGQYRQLSLEDFLSGNENGVQSRKEPAEGQSAEAGGEASAGTKESAMREAEDGPGNPVHVSGDGHTEAAEAAGTSGNRKASGFSGRKDRTEQLARMVDLIRAAYGEDAIVKGGDLPAAGKEEKTAGKDEKERTVRRNKQTK